MAEETSSALNSLSYRDKYPISSMRYLSASWAQGLYYELRMTERTGCAELNYVERQVKGGEKKGFTPFKARAR